MKQFTRPLVLLAAGSAAYLIPVLVFAKTNTACATATAICSVASTVLYLINDVAVPVIFALAFIVFIWGVFKAYILSGGDATAVSDGHRLILWGIIGFVVMISLWGLVNLVASTFGLGGQSASDLPSSGFCTANSDCLSGQSCVNGVCS
jgi:hypothetical protein